MKNKKIIPVFFVLTFLASVQLAAAESIYDKKTDTEANPLDSVTDEAAPAKTTEVTAPATVTLPPATTPPAPPPANPAPAVSKGIPNEIPVRMRLEESYDINGNRKLETQEIKILLKFVIGEVKAKGKYPVNSDLLSIHDANQDGMITPNELAPFEAYAK